MGKKYSSIFKKLLVQKNTMAVDFIVISEVVNRAIKIEYEKYLQAKVISSKDLRFKQFRDSDDGKNALSDIYQVVNRNIVNRFNVTGKLFTKTDIENFLQVNSVDFSDKGIISICKENGFVLLTNDKDFASTDLEIITSNPKILRSRDGVCNPVPHV
ncbi:MAG: twitching motility protein PilT [Thioploca sp.]|nr:twitching motility protein PilT [Thioploca sp.]